MKKYLLLACLPVLSLFSCKKEAVNTPVLGKGAVLTMLRVDAATNTFTGGKTFNYETYYSTDGKIPVSSYLRHDGDSGFLAEVYNPANDTIFYGGLSWNSEKEAQLWYPVFDELASFREGGAAANAPVYTSIQQLTPNGMALPSFTVFELWQPVAGLAITQQYMQLPNVKIGLFQYTPHQNSGDTKGQSWVWVLFKDKD